MSWKYYVGVQDPFASHFTTGPTDTTHTNIGEVQAGAIRSIYSFGESVKAQQHSQMLVNHGKFVIPTIDWDNATVGAQVFKDEMTLFANALQGIVSVIEVGNEPSQNLGQWANNGTGSYFDRLRDAIPIFHSRGIDVIMGGAANQFFQAFLTAANLNASTYSPAATSIWSLIDGYSQHPYWSIPGTTSSTGQLGNVYDRRAQVDGYGAAAAALPCWITEFGWSTQDHQGTKGNLVVSEQVQQDYLQQAYTNWVNHAATLKLKAACWFIWSDTSRYGVDMFNFCGVRTDINSTYNPVPWRYKNGGGQTGTVGIKAVLDSFGAGADLLDPPPVAVTTTATNIVKTAARLRGTADPNGTPTTISFDYGPTNAYGITTPPVSVGNGNVAVAGFADVLSLTPDTTYHYRTRAVSSAGTDLGSDVTFKTTVQPLPPVVTTGPATNIKPTGATLTGVIDPNDLSTTWHFEYGPTTSYGTSAPVPDKDL